MPIGSSKQAAVPTTPSSFNSPSPRVHDPHGPPDLHPRTRAYLLAPGLQTPDVSSEGPDEARAGGGGGGNVDGGIRCAGTTRSFREHGVSVCGRYHRGVLGLRASHAVARHGATSPIVA